MVCICAFQHLYVRKKICICKISGMCRAESDTCLTFYADTGNIGRVISGYASHWAFSDADTTVVAFICISNRLCL